MQLLLILEALVVVVDMGVVIVVDIIWDCLLLVLGAVCCSYWEPL